MKPKFKDPRLWLALASFALVIAFVWSDRERTSPGPLSPAHAADPKLSGSSGCDACHGGGQEKLATDCNVCHAAIAAELVEKKGLHGTLRGVDAARCAKCHLEHHGDRIALAGEHAFANAGVADPKKFDHAGLDFRLSGVHLALACVQCHANAEAKTLAAGSTRFLGAKQACASCHADVHQGKFSTDCATCHDQVHEFKDTSHFVHTAAFPLSGAHGSLACSACHAKDGPTSIEVVGGAGPKPAPRDCASCHASPHRESFVDGVAKAKQCAKGASCALCHAASRPFVADASGMPRELHAASGFALDTPHQRASCGDCHAPAARPVDAKADPSAHQAELLARFPGRRADDCAACHEDVHRGEFTRGPFAGSNCATCHSGEHFAPAKFDASMHSRTAFALNGGHAKVACESCHAKNASAPNAPRNFAIANDACESCHQDAHRGALLADAKATSAKPQGCGECHTVESFSTVVAERFDHAKNTRFALDGKHASAACKACHPETRHPDLPSRSFGFVADRFTGPLERCETCHADVHGGAFEKPGVPTTVENRAGCARCHTTAGFATPDADRFDHGAFTGFALLGAHAKSSCESCHGAGDGHRKLGDVHRKFAGALDRCDACHADPHEGRFDRPRVGALATVDENRGCARCHTVDSFANVERTQFDHARWTGFALDGAHQKAACEACHVPGATPSTSGMKLGRAPGSNCADCHADVHLGQFDEPRDGGVRNTDCARCHASTKSFRELRFDHQRDSHFALDATHAKVACSVCHVAWSAPGGKKVVRYKPLGSECADCHGHAGSTKTSRPDGASDARSRAAGSEPR